MIVFLMESLLLLLLLFSHIISLVYKCLLASYLVSRMKLPPYDDWLHAVK